MPGNSNDFFSTLQTEIICFEAETKIRHRTLILLLHYLAKQTGVCITTEPLGFYCISNISAKNISEQSKIDNI